MNFITMNQYFNKLLIFFLVLLITPLLVFIALYLAAYENVPGPGNEYYVALPALALLDWILGMVMFNKKIKSARNEQGLGAKLEKYFNITIVRYSFLASSGFILALGFYLTRSDFFTGLYLASLTLSAFFWPTGPRVSRELMLKGDEKEMVYYRKDTFNTD